MNESAFFDSVRKSLFHGTMTASQVSGCKDIIAACLKAGYQDKRWTAYALGTALWETDRTMQPIAEYGKGRGRKYGVPVPPHGHVYYGRGYVQLTWLENYRKANGKLRGAGMIGPDIDLAKNPELALRPDIAGLVMAIGMRDGWFTSDKLGDYFGGTHADWTGARKIINGTDHADSIAVMGKSFYAALQAGG